MRGWFKRRACIQLCARNCHGRTKRCTGSFSKTCNCQQLSHDLPNLVISTSSQTITHQPIFSWCIQYGLTYIQLLPHLVACMLPSTSSKPVGRWAMSFLCFAVKAGHWFPPDSKDHTHRLGVPSFSQKRVPRRTSTCVLLHQKQATIVGAIFVSLHCLA